jgi:hypothetical protein
MGGMAGQARSGLAGRAWSAPQTPLRSKVPGMAGGSDTGARPRRTASAPPAWEDPGFGSGRSAQDGMCRVSLTEHGRGRRPAPRVASTDAVEADRGARPGEAAARGGKALGKGARSGPVRRRDGADCPELHRPASVTRPPIAISHRKQHLDALANRFGFEAEPGARARRATGDWRRRSIRSGESAGKRLVCPRRRLRPGLGGDA